MTIQTESESDVGILLLFMYRLGLGLHGYTVVSVYSEVHLCPPFLHTLKEDGMKYGEGIIERY